MAAGQRRTLAGPDGEIKGRRHCRVGSAVEGAPETLVRPHMRGLCGMERVCFLSRAMWSSPPAVESEELRLT